MDRFISSLFVTFAFLSMAASQQLPCDSPLRRFAVLADYFAHCECRYGNWTDVVPYANATLIAVPPSQCSSGFGILGERRQEAITEQCQNKTEESYVCSRSYACQYGNWSDGVVPSVNATVVGVPRNQCRSGFARQGQRWQAPISGYIYGCEDKIEEIYLCEPTDAERLVMRLELAGRGQNHRQLNFARDELHFNTINHNTDPPHLQGPTVTLPTRLPIIPASLQTQPPEIWIQIPHPPQICTAQEVCNGQGHHRSVRQELKRPQLNTHHLPVEPEPLPVNPIPFDFTKHSARYRRDTNVNCQPHNMKYVLFVLDTSTSIGVEKFNTITASLSKLVHLFCKAIKVAVMTFSHEHYAEFCFGCYGNDCVGRDRARDAMRNINFRSGLTFTGEAAQCVCDFMLSPACGFPNLYSTVGNAKRCLDVVFVTDGGSNGHRNVCEEVQCLHNLTATHVHVIAMGVGRYKQRELDCITEGFPEKDQFKFKDFEDLSNVIEAGERLIKSQTTPVTCFNTETVFGLDPSSDCQ